MKMFKHGWIGILLALVGLTFFPLLANAQSRQKNLLSEINYDHPQKYVIGGINVSGINYLDKSVVIMLSNLEEGQKVKIPGDAITTAIRNLWHQGLFDNVSIYATKIKDDTIYLNIYLQEKPKLNEYNFSGIKKSEQDDLKDKINLTRGDVVSKHLINRTENIIKNYYRGKGYLNTQVNITRKNAGPRKNRKEFVDITINVKKNKKVKIATINIYGNHAFSKDKVRKAMKDTREKGYFNPLNPLGLMVVHAVADAATFRFKKLRDDIVGYAIKNYRLQIFKSSKFIRSKFQDDLNKIITEYNSAGYRDAQILKDSIYRIDKTDIGINIHLKEGDKYYYRKITWIGNTIYTSRFLSAVLAISPGDVYNKKLLETNLNYNDKGFDVSSLYMNNGYLFFSATPVETYVNNDSIDLEIRVHEGKQARINKVTVSGNTKTNDHVVIRELRTKPGQLFSRSDVIRSVRELANLKYFNAQNLKPDIKPNPANGTVNINYNVEETSADQIELSGGWGYGRIIGTVGLSFNNFSLRNFFNMKAWKPVPSGDGQKLSIRFQTYGAGYMSAGITFTEPWLGGKKPNALTVSYYYSLYSLNSSSMSLYGGSSSIGSDSIGNRKFASHAITVGLGKRLKWPDDYFTLSQSVNVQLYNLENYASIFPIGNGNGNYNNLNYNIVLGRNSIDAPIYPRSGSDISLSLAFTPPYSLFSKKDYQNLPDAEKYKWIEYYKWKFKSYLYFQIMNKLVLVTKAKFGYLGAYNSEIGVTPFERFYLGGDGLSGYNNYDGREIIGMRGYANESITPDYYNNRNLGGTIYSRYTLELRYPISLAPTSTIYIEAFFEAGNAWAGTHDFDPFNLKRAAGIGARIYLPMFGLLGLDWGYGFDPIPGIPSANGSHFAFSMNGSLD